MLDVPVEAERVQVPRRAGHAGEDQVQRTIDPGQVGVLHVPLFEERLALARQGDERLDVVVGAGGKRAIHHLQRRAHDVHFLAPGDP
ncbi:MAG: hypothetical protein JSV86_09350 [Gemmatimonadota bacterium]|nr:MAG: hypothetical protein JSV86_09350 [Gemmatimonadota bacterium]